MKNKYQLPHPIRMQVIWLVRDYERMKNQYNELAEKSPGPPDGQPRGGSSRDIVQETAMKRIELAAKIEAVEEAYKTIPPEYRRGVWDNVLYRARYPSDAGTATYKRQRKRFLYLVAKKLFWV